MRLRSLRLQRYGSFEDLTVPFGPGVTVVYGPNEAGKSTLRAALGDFLWGISRSHHPHAFKYVPGMMLLQGTVHVADTTYVLTRRLDRLSDSDNNDLAPPWDPDSSRDRQGWLTAFGMDLRGLQAGGQEIIASGGDLADLIFLAETGILIDRLRQDLESRRDEIYKDRKNARCLVRTLLSEIQELEIRAEAEESSASDVLALRDKVDDLTGQISQLGEDWSVSERTRGRLEELERCFEPAASLRESERNLQALLADGPVLDPADTKQLEEALSLRATLAESLQEIQRDILSNQTRRSRLALNRNMLEAGALIERFRESLEARRDDQRRVASTSTRDALTANVVDALRRLGSLPGEDLATEVSARLLPDPVRGQLTRTGGELAAALENLRKQRAKIDTLAADSRGVEPQRDADQQDLFAARDSRDTAWAAVRTPWLSGEVLAEDTRQTLATAVDLGITEADRTAESHAGQLAAAAERRGTTVEREHRRAQELTELEAIAVHVSTLQQTWMDLLIASNLTPTMDPEAWREYDSHLSDLTDAWAALKLQIDTVAAAHGRLADFTDEVGELATLVPAKFEDPVRLTEALADALTRARQQQSKSEEIDRRIADLELRRADAETDAGAASDVITRLTVGLGGSPADLLIRSQARDRLVVSKAMYADQIHHAKQADSDLAQLLDDLMDADREQIRLDKEAAVRASEELSRLLKSTNEALGAAKRDLREREGRSSVAELRSQAVTKGEALRNLIDEYRQCVLQLEMLDAYAQQLAESTDSPTLQSAGEHLRRLTGGRFVGFTSKDGESQRIQILFSDPSDVDQEPMPLELSSLSEGTADQAFLAMRLAGIKSRQAQRTRVGLPPLPVVLDDVLMAHDDYRAAAAIEILGDLSTDMQVILLTHHRSVLEAAQAMASVATHELHAAPAPEVEAG